MGFFNEFVDLFKGEEIDDSFKVVLLGTTAIMVEGYKKLITLEENMVELSLPKGKIIIKGAKLCIKTISRQEVVISGKVLEFMVV